jgi:Hsp70 protein
VQDGMLDIEAKADAAEWSIGIDFGTAFSKAAATRLAVEQGAVLREVRPLRIGEAAGWNRPFLTPSSMFLDRERIFFGPWAADRLAGANADERELLRSFKTILGANDFEGALDFYPRACIDPDRLFRMRDLITLYLAYLLALVDVASARAFGRGGSIIGASKVRFSRPGWLPDRIAAAHEAMTSLFSHAHIVRNLLGEDLLEPNGVDYAMARNALDSARADGSLFESLDGGIYEASAVGLCHFNDAGAPNCLLIVDVGGGTTDVAGLIRAPQSEDIRVIRTARRTIDVAGDDFDGVLLDALLVKAKRLKTKRDRTAFWRRIVPHIRDLKEELFEKGEIEVSFRKIKVKYTARELERQQSFKATLGEIGQLYEASLAEVVKAARQQRARKIGVVLAGGGSRLPALRALITRPRWVGFGMKIVYLPATPAWAHELGSAQEFESLFAQLSAAFGAAISGQQRGEV